MHKLSKLCSMLDDDKFYKFQIKRQTIEETVGREH